MAAKAAKKPPAKKPAAKKPAPETGGDTGQRNPLEDLGRVNEEIKGGAAKKPAAKKRGPGRPKKKPEPEPVELMFDTQQMEMGLNVIMSLVAKRLGNHWLLTEKEISDGAIVFDALVQKYFPLIGPWMVEINCLIWISMTIGPRAYLHYELLKQAKEAAEREKQDDSTAE